jgi:hypothetical protein
MKWLTLAAMLLVPAAGAPQPEPPKPRVPVLVQLTGDDGLTQKLSDSLEQGLRKHPRLRLASTAGEAVVTIRSESNVGWDKLSGRLVVIYTLYIDKGEPADEPITGICYEIGMAKCVKDILRIASLEGDAH